MRVAHVLGEGVEGTIIPPEAALRFGDGGGVDAIFPDSPSWACKAAIWRRISACRSCSSTLLLDEDSIIMAVQGAAVVILCNCA